MSVDWLNLHYSTLDSEAVVGSEPVDRATWLFLLRYCCGQENGGVLRGARLWGDRRWQQLCRVTLAEVMRETELWSWDGDDLRVAHYPIDKESEVRAKREGGAAGARARWNGSANSSANGSAINNPHAEGKGKEGKGKEGKGREAEPSTPPPLSFPSGDQPPSKAQAKRERLVALLKQFGCTTEFKGEPILTEWFNAIDGYPIEWIEELYQKRRQRPHMPSGLRKVLATSEFDYTAWKIGRPREGTA